MKAAPWPGEPGTCQCTRLVVATLEETLSCPAGWRPVPGGGWAHTLRDGRPQMAGAR